MGRGARWAIFSRTILTANNSSSYRWGIHPYSTCCPESFEQLDISGEEPWKFNAHQKCRNGFSYSKEDTGEPSAHRFAEQRVEWASPESDVRD